MEKNSISLLALLAFLKLLSFNKADDICISKSLSYSKLYNLNEIEIKENNLGKVNVGDCLQIKEVFFDECGKKASASLSMN